MKLRLTILSCLICLSVFSQSFVRNYWTTNQVPSLEIPVTNGLILFTHPLSGIVANATNSDLVSRWLDASGNSNDLSQPNPTLQPTRIVRGLAGGVFWPLDYNAVIKRHLIVPNSVTASSTASSIFIIGTPIANFYNKGLFQATGLTPSLLHYGASSPRYMTLYDGSVRGSLLYPTSGRSFEGCALGTDVAIVFRDEESARLAALNAATWTGGIIGGFNNSMPYQGLIQSVLVYNRCLDNYEVTRLRRWSELVFNTDTDCDQTIVVLGDSITTGVGSTNDVTPWCNLVSSQTRRVHDIGSSGETAVNLVNNATNDAFAILSASTGKRVAVLFAGTNDKALAGADTNAVWTAYTNFYFGAHYRGFKVVLATVLPRNQDAAFETWRLGLNNLITNNISVCADAIADIGSDGSIGNVYSVTNRYYSIDKIHPSNDGYEVIAYYMRRGLRKVFE